MNLNGVERLCACVLWWCIDICCLSAQFTKTICQLHNINDSPPDRTFFGCVFAGGRINFRSISAPTQFLSAPRSLLFISLFLSAPRSRLIISYCPAQPSIYFLLPRAVICLFLSLVSAPRSYLFVSFTGFCPAQPFVYFFPWFLPRTSICLSLSAPRSYSFILLLPHAAIYFSSCPAQLFVYFFLPRAAIRLFISALSNYLFISFGPVQLFVHLFLP